MSDHLEDVNLILGQDRATATPFTVRRLEKAAAANWDRFYRQHQTNFFKDRHWTDAEFSVLRTDSSTPNDRDLDPFLTSSSEAEAESGSIQPPLVLLEVGCGVGNMFYPLLEKHDAIKVHCCDFSPRAVEMVKHHPLYTEERVNAFVYDIAKADSLAEPLEGHKFGVPTIISLIFVLSAIPPTDHITVMTSLSKALSPGGSLIFRDYARGDLAQMRFHTSPQKQATKSWTEPSLLSEHFDYYRRGDNTLTQFFTESYLQHLATQAGLVGEVKVVEKTVFNRKEGLEMKRRFVQARWLKSGPIHPD